MRLRYAGLATALLCLGLTSCQLSNTLPATETDGSHLKLPEPSTRLVVWGTHPGAVRSLKTWLLKQGYIVVDELKISQLGRDKNVPMPLSNVEVLNLAKTAGAKEAIFVDADVFSWNIPEVLNVFGQSPSSHRASVFIRALDAETGEIDWSAKAVSVDKFPDLANGIHQLTCNALATGWGLRKPGIAAPAHICPPGQNVMVLDEIPPTSKDIVKSSNGTELNALSK